MSTAARLRALAGDVVQGLRGHDLLLYAAGLTFYAAIALIPLLLAALALAQLVLGEGTVNALTLAVTELVPQRVRGDVSPERLADIAARLALPGLVPVFLVATLYGEGLVRALDRLSVHQRTAVRGLRGRALTPVLIAVATIVLVVGLAAAAALVRALGEGLGPQLLGAVLGFLLGWLALTLLLVITYRAFSPERLLPRAVLYGAATASAATAAAGQVLALVLRVGPDPGSAFGGSPQLGIAALVASFLYYCHVVVLLGYVLAAQVHARDGRLLGDRLRSSPIS